MPIPTQRSDETEDEFVSRCMSDSVMVREYPDEDQRLAICIGHMKSGGNGDETSD